MPTHAETQETSDLPMATYVVARGFPVTGTRREDRRVFFQFQVSPAEFTRLVTDYQSGGLIGAQLFATAFRQLKKLAFSVINEVDR